MVDFDSAVSELGKRFNLYAVAYLAYVFFALVEGLTPLLFLGTWIVYIILLIVLILIIVDARKLAKIQRNDEMWRFANYLFLSLFASISGSLLYVAISFAGMDSLSLAIIEVGVLVIGSLLELVAWLSLKSYFKYVVAVDLQARGNIAARYGVIAYIATIVFTLVITLPVQVLLVISDVITGKDPLSVMSVLVGAAIGVLVILAYYYSGKVLVDLSNLDKATGKPPKRVPS
jgi:hypothetical protein